MTRTFLQYQLLKYVYVYTGEASLPQRTPISCDLTRNEDKFSLETISLSTNTSFNYLFFKRFYLFIFREGEGREKEEDRNINMWVSLACPLLGTWPATQACALTGNRTSDPLVCRSELNPLSHASQGSFNYLFIRIFKNVAHFHNVEFSKSFI